MCRRRHMRNVALSIVTAAGVLIIAWQVAQAGSVPDGLRRSFLFPAALASGVTGELVSAPGGNARLSFDRGIVAIGYLPVLRADRVSRRRTLGARDFVRPADAGPRARLLLTGVADTDGNLVTNTGNELMIDAVVSPSSAAVSPPPFVIPFDINAGTAFVDAALPLDGQGGAAARVQVLGAAVIDPDGQPFGVLGFAMVPASPASPPPALAPGWTPTPGVSPADGRCFVGPTCTGTSFPASRDTCCHLGRSGPGARMSTVSWCPGNQYDPATGQCTAGACDTCFVPATPTPTAGPCADEASCGGSCAVTCADGATVAGQCIESQDQRCACSAVCNAPTPCSVGQCFDTVNFQCTGQPCGPGLRCPLPNQFCDVSGRRCPCAPPPPPPIGHICCQCTDPTPACFTLSLGAVQPICPSGCKTFVQQECDPRSDTCVAAQPCATDQDCDDGNGCTIDRCSGGACLHDCVCVGPLGCGPGPSRR
jgi:hypothetical protein